MPMVMHFLADAVSQNQPDVAITGAPATGHAHIYRSAEPIVL